MVRSHGLGSTLRLGDDPFQKMMGVKKAFTYVSISSNAAYLHRQAGDKGAAEAWRQALRTLSQQRCTPLLSETAE